MSQDSENRMSQVVVVDKDPAVRRMLGELLTKAGYSVRKFPHADRAIKRSGMDDPGVLLIDLETPGRSARDIIHALRNRFEDAYLILMSRVATHQDLSALHEGAYDSLTKPLNADEVLLVLKNVRERDRLVRENLRLKEEVDRHFGLDAIVAHSPSMVHLKSVVRKFAPYKTSVLITGESGTGKDLLARALHHASDRCNEPLVAINCAAIPESLLESELFGHMKGAFTGAVRTRKGLVQDAHLGTLFLDEIGEMPVSLQAKLLRVLETEEVRPIGGTRTVGVDVRIVCSTSRDLSREVAAGRFREDLFYRINVLTLKIAALRERREDIPPLVDHLVEQARVELRREIHGVTPQAMRMFFAHDWPGNVRELKHVIERGAILATDGWIDVDTLPPEMGLGKPLEAEDDLSIKRAVKRIERDLIARALRRTSGNRTHAAGLLDISHRTLLYKIKQYGIELGDDG